MFGDGNRWDNIGSSYYNVSVLEVKTTQADVFIRVIGSTSDEGSIKNSEFQVPASDVRDNSGYAGVMSGIGDLGTRYLGRIDY